MSETFVYTKEQNGDVIRKVVFYLPVEVEEGSFTLTQEAAGNVQAYPRGDVHSVWSVEVTGLQDIEEFTAQITFRVPRAWIEDRLHHVRLYRFSTRWSVLRTALAATDELYAYYTAETTGFSNFAVVIPSSVAKNGGGETPSRTSKVGYKPNIKTPRREIAFDIRDFREPATGVREIPAEDRQLLDAYVNQAKQIFDELDQIDAALDKQLEDMAISYDPQQFPDFHDAHRHLCGNPSATTVITYQDVKNRWAVEKSQVVTSILGDKLAFPFAVDNIDGLTHSDLAAVSSKNISDMVKKMLDAVWRQILVWVLEWFAKMFSPLGKVKFVNVVPKLLNRAIDKIRGNPNAGPANIDAVLGSPELSGEEEIALSGEGLSQQGGGYINNLSELDSAASTFSRVFKSDHQVHLPPECYGHTAVWNNTINPLIRDTKWAAPYHAKMLNTAMRERMESMDKLAGLTVPDGYLVNNPDGTSIKYVNPLPDEYIRARADGSTRATAFGQGMLDSMGDFRTQYIRRAQEIIRQFTVDPSVLCCLIKNLNLTWNSQGLRKMLLYIQALLLLWRNILLMDLAAELANLGNMILELLNQLLQAIFSLYTALFYNTLSKWAAKITDLSKLKVVDRCLPWNQLIDLAVQIFAEMVARVLDYLSGFFSHFRLDVQRAAVSADKLKTVAFIDKMLDLINKIIQFAATWAICSETGQDPRAIATGNNRLRVDDTGRVFLAPRAATKGDEGTGSLILSPAITNAALNGSGGAANEAFSPQGIQIFLTGFVGLDPAKAREVVDGINDCSCDKALTTEELAILEKAIKRNNA